LAIDNGNSRGRRLYRQHSGSIGDDRGHLTTYQLSRHCWHSIVLPVRPAVFDRDILALDIAGFLQTPTDPITGIAGCCARAASDHAAVAAARVAKNFRRAMYLAM
jgi:hypothetical protein